MRSRRMQNEIVDLEHKTFLLRAHGATKLGDIRKKVPERGIWKVDETVSTREDGVPDKK